MAGRELADLVERALAGREEASSGASGESSDGSSLSMSSSSVDMVMRLLLV